MKAIIFDMDGVLINSEVKYQELFMQFFKDRGVFIEKDTFNKLGYKTKINTHITSCINLFLDIYLYSEYRLIYC